MLLLYLCYRVLCYLYILELKGVAKNHSMRFHAVGGSQMDTKAVA